jgi:hypothetical protein
MKPILRISALLLASAGLLTPSIAAAAAIHPLIVVQASRTLHTVSHEMIHMLLDDVHPDEKGNHDNEFRFFRRLWSGGPDGGKYYDRKRMSKTESDYVVKDILKSPLVPP